MWILIDNYDSFTYILHHYLLQTGHECTVYRNDELTLQELIALQPERLIISPGPETPLQAGICIDAIAHFHDKIPILGICLGHQALGMYFGAKLIHAPYPMHGKTSNVTHNGHPLFKDIPTKFQVMRYHSLAVEDFGNTGLISLAIADDNTVMALAHEKHLVIGIQYHPESIGSHYGLQILQNWAGMY
ncbi:MAG: aminodeoxychorismate/anthranilate synthase component II [Sphingobacteriales bacterium]|nr:MAG: aminodeoxychorismate/anthranilate synthase component II [Sphingobacteriales bacterium]